MRLFLALVIAVLTHLSALAQTDVTTRIHDIDEDLAGEPPLIYLASGQVVSYPAATKSRLDDLRAGMRVHRWYRIRLNDRREIVAIRKTNPPVPAFPAAPPAARAETFVPSVLPSLEAARSFFAEARRDFAPESQCYDRAHAWAFDWRRRHRFYSSKTWIFFTRRFIRKHKFEWWFHVAPAAHVVVEGRVRERVLDVKYARGPLSLKQWTDAFLRDNAHCPVVDRYRDHADFSESGSCFVMKTSMYYYQPIDLELLDLTGAIRDRWHAPEVRNAFREAFGVNL
jgi:hypothetical protein